VSGGRGRRAALLHCHQIFKILRIKNKNKNKKIWKRKLGDVEKNCFVNK
jgi:hypothetical protein